MLKFIAIVGLIAIFSGCASMPEGAPQDVIDTHNELRAHFPWPPRSPGDQISSVESPVGDCKPYSLMAKQVITAKGHSASVVVVRNGHIPHAFARAVVDGAVWVFDIEERYPIRGPTLPRFDDVPIDF